MAPSDPRRPPSDGAESDPSDPPGERCGPVAITRTVKDDGRTLILFAHEERAGEEPAQA
jgi:hypothetical protein